MNALEIYFRRIVGGSFGGSIINLYNLGVSIKKYLRINILIMRIF
jgi:hypothetical protein